MIKTSLDTLFIPFSQEGLEIPDKTLFLGAAAHPFLQNLKDVHCYQPFKPLADVLTAFGCDVLTDIPENSFYNFALVHCPKQADEAKSWLAYAAQSLKDDGVLLAAADNDSGGGRIKGWMEELGFDTHSLSKHKARAVWGVRPKNIEMSTALGWIETASPKVVNFGDGITLKSQSGLFSWNRMDKGTALLLSFLPDNIKGRGADFGAGIGALSYGLLRGQHAIQHLHLVEADWRALEHAKINLENVRGDVYLHSHWHDLSKPIQNLDALDFIVMNPPFHNGKKNDVGLGKSFVQNAAYHLRRGGVLYMVANVHLPYEDILQSHFSNVVTVVQKDGFKIFKAIK